MLIRYTVLSRKNSNKKLKHPYGEMVLRARRKQNSVPVQTNDNTHEKRRLNNKNFHQPFKITEEVS